MKEYLIQNGEFKYKIIYPAKHQEDEYFAVNELANFIYLATGTNIEIVLDTALCFCDKLKYISVGKTKLMQDLNIVVDENLVFENGFMIKTIGQDIFIVGTTATGTLNGVYKFLKNIIGLETYGQDCTVYNKNIKEIILKEYNIISNPDIAYNVVSIGFLNEKLCKRMQFCQNGWMTINNSGEYHNSFAYLPPNEYLDIYPKWYSDDKSQLCYTAHGDEKLLAIMIGTVCGVLKNNLMKDTKSRRVTMTQQDEFTWCTCETCSALRQKYGTDAASVIHFLNRVSNEIKEWFASEEGKPYARELDICFFAYHPTQNAPTLFDKNSNRHVVIDDSVVLNDNVCVFYAPITANYNKSFYDKDNVEFYQTMKAWSAVSKRLYMWTYCTNFHYYLAPYDSFRSISGTYKSLKETGTYYLFDQNQYNNDNSTGFTVLKAYLSSKLAWKVDENIEELIDIFFNNYYGDASKEMKQCFDLLRENFYLMEDIMNFSGDIFEPPLRRDLFSKKFLNRCLDHIDNAYIAISGLYDKNQAEYDRINKAITLESIAFRYLMIELYGLEYGEIFEDIKKQFKKDILFVGITNCAERSKVDKVYADWDKGDYASITPRVRK